MLRRLANVRRLGTEIEALSGARQSRQVSMGHGTLYRHFAIAVGVE